MKYLQLDLFLNIKVMAWFGDFPSAVFLIYLWKRKHFEGVSAVKKPVFKWMCLIKDEVASACYVFHLRVSFMDLLKNCLWNFVVVTMFAGRYSLIHFLQLNWTCPK